jgi:hypothetical protein
MLKPAMNKHFFAILLLLLCLLFTGLAEARLTLGIVPGTQDSSGEVSLGQANALAELLTENLQEEVVVKELADSSTLINWIDRLAMLDLALLSSKDVEANPGRFLSVGKIHPESDLLLVSRQGVSGAWLQRVAEVLREPGVSTAETTQQIVSQPPLVAEKSPSAAEQEPLPVDEVIEVQNELEHVPPLSPGRAWTPQKEGLYRDLLPSDEPPLKTLVLGVIPDLKGLLRTTQQAQQLAIYLEQALPVSVTVREFASIETFAEGFMRYRMIDLAILPRTHAEMNLGRDYQPLVKLLRSDKPGEESAELVIMRRGQIQELLGPLQQTLLVMAHDSNGQDLMKALSVSEVLALEDAAVLPTVVEAMPEPVQDAFPVPVAMPEEVVESAVEVPPQPTPEHADPLEPLAPPAVVVKPIPAVPQPGQPPVVPSTDVIAVTVPELPAETIKPSEPAGPTVANPIEIPEIASPAAEPFKPSAPLLPPVAAETAPPEPLAVAKPPAVTQTPESVEAAVIVEAPIVVEAPAMPQKELTQALDSPVAREVTELAIPVLDEVISTQVPEEPGLAALPQEETAFEPVELTEPSTTPTNLVGKTVDEPVVPVISEPFEDKTPFVETIVLEPEPLPITSVIPIVTAEQEQDILEETGRTTDFSPEGSLTEEDSVLDDEVEKPLLDTEILAFLGENTVASMISQPDIPQALRPPGIPTVRPSPTSTLTEPTGELIVASIPEPLRRTFSAPVPQLLPDLVPEPGVIYVIPFAAVMVPNDFNARVFDQFVDLLNQGGEDLGLQFVILKEDLRGVDPDWLAVRQYVTGEIYGYVEDSGCCSTDLRTKARLTYRRPKQKLPAFRYEYPVRIFFEHDRSTIDIERAKVAEEIAENLSSELLTVLRN